MKLSDVKNILLTVNTLTFQLPDGTFVPKHFHITEVGIISKTFIDCGGTVRQENVVNFQLWNASDLDHRLQPEKLLGIIKLSEKVLGLEDLEIEVEYQSDTIGKYNLEFKDGNFLLTNKQTDCLAKDKCGIPTEQKSCCTPSSGCC